MQRSLTHIELSIKRRMHLLPTILLQTRRELPDCSEPKRRLRRCGKILNAIEGLQAKALAEGERCIEARWCVLPDSNRCLAQADTSVMLAKTSVRAGQNTDDGDRKGDPLQARCIRRGSRRGRPGGDQVREEHLRFCGRRTQGREGHPRHRAVEAGRVRWFE